MTTPQLALPLRTRFITAATVDRRYFARAADRIGGQIPPVLWATHALQATRTALTRDRGGPVTTVNLPRLAFIAAVGLVALNACDLVITRQILSLGDNAQEANPIMAMIILSWFGVALKVGLPAVVGWMHIKKPTHALGLAWVCVLYLCVLTWNLHVLAVKY